MIFSIQTYADDEWHEKNCKPYKSESIFKVINQKVDEYLFEIKYIRGNSMNDSGEWYDPECGFSSVTITRSNDPSFKGFIEYENGYIPKIVKIIKNKLSEKYAFISQFSGGTAGSYIYVISLQSGKEIGDPIKDVEFTNGIINSRKWGFESVKSCSTEFYANYQVTYMKDKKITQYTKDDYLPFKSLVNSEPKEFKSRNELKKECPKLDDKIIQSISSL